MDKFSINLTKSQDRIDQFGECFTPPRIVNQMLDRIPLQDWKDPSKKICDPSCGNGNFLVEVLRRKIENGSTPLQATNTTFGIDVMKDNIIEAHKRLLDIVKEHAYGKTLRACADNIVKNIRCADALKYDFEFKEFKNSEKHKAYVNFLIDSLD